MSKGIQGQESDWQSAHGFNATTPIRADRHPFPLLLYLEWGLLGLAILSQLLPSPFRDTLPLFKSLALFCTIAFGVMGLYLPRNSSQLAWILLQLSLMGLAGWWGGFRGVRLFPLLCIVLVLRSSLVLPLSGRLITSGIAYLLFLVLLLTRLAALPIARLSLRQGTERPLIGAFAFNSALLLFLAIGFVLLLVHALITERRSRDQLHQAHTQLRQYALQVEDLAMEQERNRIAREIHDSLGHALTALNLQLEGALKLSTANPTRSQEFLKEAKMLGSKALQEVRRAVTAMRADPLAGKPLSESLQKLIEEFQRHSGIEPHCQIQLNQPLSPELSMAVYRVVQESLTNISKYAKATQVTIDLTTQADWLYLRIQDDGCGFDPDQNQAGFGLQGMRERVTALGGQIQIHSQPYQGCWIVAQLPIRPT